LRRIGRRREASTALEAAMTIFASLSAGPSEQEATDELRRARPRPRHDDALTEAELRVAALVASGRSNKDVAAELFTTVATVEAHLTRVYSKLGIRSRSELAHRATELIPTVSR
jgi:DNA-binding NarL/FixJ family response regulator